METKINKITDYLNNMNAKVVEVTKDYYTLDNGDVFEHTFDIDDSITCEEFQSLLDNAKNIVLKTISTEQNDVDQWSRCSR